MRFRLKPETRLRVQTPVSGRIVVFKDGAVLLDENGISSKEIAMTERGRLPGRGLPAAARERWWPQKPWIISNPIYVR